MNKKQYARQIYHALGDIDAEMLYDARAYRAPKIRPYIRYIAAAVIVIAVLSAALMINSANTVKSVLTIDTNYGVTLELNAGGRVVRATSAASLYELPAQDCRRLEAEEAVARLTEKMGERGGLNDHANTVLIGVPDDGDIADALIEGFSPDKYCIIRVGYDDSDAVQKLARKRRITAGKAALLMMLSDADFGIGENRLFRLSANDIALLMQDKEIENKDMTVSGKPLDGGYLSEKAVGRLAAESAGFTPENIVCSLDSDGFRLVYTVLLYNGDTGASYVIDAADGVIRREFHGTPRSVRDALEKTREEFGDMSENTPPNQTSPTPAPVAADSPTQQPASQAPAESASSAVTPAEKPTSAQRHDAKTVTEPAGKPTQAATSPTELPDKEHTYLTAGRWAELPDLSDIELIRPLSQASHLLSWMNANYESHMMKSFEELNQFFDDYPYYADDDDFCSGDLYSRIDKYHASDFDGRVLITTEYPRGSASEFLHDVYLFRIGDTLYAGVFQRRAQLEGNTIGATYIRRHMWVDKKDLEGVRQLKMVELTYEDVFNSRLENLYEPVNDAILRTSEWSSSVPEDLLTTKHKVSIDLRLFNDTLPETYPRDVSVRDQAYYAYYDHTAALLTSAQELKNYRSGMDKNIYDLPYPSDTYMQTHAILMTTYVKCYNIPSYFVTAWKKNGVMYVAFTDESSGGAVRKPLDTPYVRVGMIEFEKEQVKDVDRIEIVHIKGQFGKTGSGFVLVDPWD